MGSGDTAKSEIESLSPHSHISVVRKTTQKSMKCQELYVCHVVADVMEKERQKRSWDMLHTGGPGRGFTEGNMWAQHWQAFGVAVKMPPGTPQSTSVPAPGPIHSPASCTSAGTPGTALVSTQPGFRLQPGSPLADAGMQRVNQHVEDLSICFQSCE